MFKTFLSVVDKKETPWVIGHAFWTIATNGGQEVVTAAINYLKRSNPELARLLAYNYTRSYM